MLLDDLVDVLLVDVGIPDLLGVHDHHRALLAAVHAAGRVDAREPGAVQPELLHALLGVLLHRLGAVAGAAVLGRLALVEAHEDVVLVEAHGIILPAAGGGWTDTKRALPHGSEQALRAHSSPAGDEVTAWPRQEMRRGRGVVSPRMPARPCASWRKRRCSRPVRCRRRSSTAPTSPASPPTRRA